MIKVILWRLVFKMERLEDGRVDVQTIKNYEMERTARDSGWKLKVIHKLYPVLSLSKLWNVTSWEFKLLLSSVLILFCRLMYYPKFSSLNNKHLLYCVVFKVKVWGMGYPRGSHSGSFRKLQSSEGLVGAAGFVS